MKPKKVCIVAEWLTWRGGSESVIDALLEAFPGADFYTTVYNAKKLPEYKKFKPQTSFLQKIPIARKKHQSIPPLLLKAISSLNLSGHDLIISSSSSIGKGIKKPKNSVHICYCHTPMRYVWQPEIDKRLVKLPLGKYFINYLKKWDLRTNKNVDYFLTNSSYTKERIRRIYKRGATVIYPPVKIHPLPRHIQKQDFYFCLSRLIPYKKIDLAIRACENLSRKLIVAGEGPELKKLRKIAGSTTKFIGRIDDKKKMNLLRKAKALIFPCEDDFGIVPIEAMSQGTPIIAYKKGGARESVLDGKTGILFEKQSVKSLTAAIRKFEKSQFDQKEIIRRAKGFSKQRFIKEIKKFIKQI